MKANYTLAKLAISNEKDVIKNAQAIALLGGTGTTGTSGGSSSGSGSGGSSSGSSGYEGHIDEEGPGEIDK